MEEVRFEQCSPLIEMCLLKLKKKIFLQTKTIKQTNKKPLFFKTKKQTKQINKGDNNLDGEMNS